MVQNQAGVAVFTVAFAVTMLAGPKVAGAASRPASIPSYEKWQTDVKRVMDPAIPWLEKRVRRGDANLAIVLDIDNTALESHYHRGQPNKPVFDVAMWAHRHHVSVLFATARSEADYDSTWSELKNAGYPIESLCMRKPSDEGAAATKQRCRKEYEEAGYSITANIGNRFTDLEGENYEKGFKLPDYHGGLS